MRVLFLKVTFKFPLLRAFDWKWSPLLEEKVELWIFPVMMAVPCDSRNTPSLLFVSAALPVMVLPVIVRAAVPLPLRTVN